MPTVLGALSPQHLLELLGVIGVLLILFAETGLLFGVILPGDSLLFVAGYATVAGNSLPGDLQFPLGWLLLATAAGAIAGAQVGFEIGRRAGPALFRRPDSRLFRREYVDKTNAFFERYGARAIVLARFVPIVRTFITVTAGVGRMNYRVYTTYTVIGGVLWAAGITILGHALGNVDFVAKHIELILIAIVAVSVVPVAIELLRQRSKSREDPQPNPRSAAE
jgi:membrane-associated protein